MGSAKHRESFNARARRSAPDDFWSQVQRTVNGKPVDEEQIAMIVDAIVAGLELEPQDFVLDLCCGNGALSDRVFARCAGGLGVDFAEELIAIAERHFQRIPERAYVAADVQAFARTAQDTSRFTKALCYGSLQLLPAAAAAGLLVAVRTRFPAVRALYLGNMPDKARVRDFYTPEAYRPGIEDDHESPIGIWRTEEELRALAEATGWSATVTRLPSAFYASRYRYDAVLRPRG